MANLITLNPYHPEAWLVEQAAKRIRDGEIAVIPTDTVYAIVASVESRDAPDRLNKLKGVEASDPKKPFSVLFPDLSSVADYTRGLPNHAYRIMKRALPGPYTFILPAGKKLPAAAVKKRETIGVRMPGHPVCLALLEVLGVPLLATSVVAAEDEDPLDDPVEISTRLGHSIGLILDVGPLLPEPSTVVDLTQPEMVILREGKGPIDVL